MAAGSTYTPIATATASGSSSTITFNSISGSYTDLILIAGLSGASADLDIRFNNDSGSNYSYTRTFADSTGAYSDRGSNSSAGFAITIGGANPGVQIVNIFNYSNTTTYKTITQYQNNPGAYVGNYVGLWRSTAAINRIDIYAESSNNISANCVFTLYGITAA